MVIIGILVTCDVNGQINVFAGDDSSICPGGVLELDELNAVISGEVTDGTWFSLGDGYFTPGNANDISFEEAQTYVPGPGDINNGWFTLLLASNYGQVGQESDIVNISFQTAPPLACNSSINISLADNCEQEVTPELVLSNPTKPYNRYIITLYDEKNILIADNVLKKEHIGQIISVGVTHACDPINSCWGEIRVEDKNPPDLICENDTIKCTSSISPEILGFPVSGEVVLEKLGNDKWAASGLDECTDAVLWFEDDEMAFNCDSEFEKVIFRTWRARDEHDNIFSCVEEIYIRKDSLVDVIMPPNFDNIDKTALECDSIFPRLLNGYPHPDHTGYPEITNCSNLESTFNDVEFDICGAGHKVLRAWLVIDWCTAESRNHNQIIKIQDSNPPKFNCPSDIIVETTDYSCLSKSFLIDDNLDIIDCSETSFSWTIFDSLGTILANGDNTYLADLPLGTHNVEYTVVDDCGNSSICSSKVIVIDRIAPTAVCDQYTSIALGIDGTARLYAESLDDGSHDNCYIISMEVAKMTDKCNYGLATGPYVEFCCAEAGDTVMVSFTVTDIHGNKNTCMVTVEVEEKLPPQLVCPSDLTISCRLDIDFNDLSGLGKIVLSEDLREYIYINDGLNDGVAGIDGFTNDNCGVMISELHSAPLECRQGLISRTFTATDDGGIQSSCTQNITIIDENPFNYEDIKWPLAYNDETCVDSTISPDISGTPTYSNDHCSQLASTYKDKLFPFAEGSCMKIIREWTVIDWCQFDEKTSAGVWNNSQILKLENTIAPIISNLCIDTLVCLYDEECLTTRYFTTIEASDDCTLTEELFYLWTYDENSNGNIDSIGNSKIIDIITVIGVHTINVKVEDRCGNITHCTYQIEVKDCKAPNPYCISDVTTVLMHTNNEIEIWANDFNFNSSDNCTPLDEFIYSFDQDTSIRSRILTCDDIVNGVSGNVDLEMWVTDNAGNQEYCQVTIHVQDNNDNCEDQEFQVMISGKILTPTGAPVSNVVVDLTASSPEYSSVDQTNGEGNYAFVNIPNYLEVDIEPHKLDEVDFGVSTLDIVLIQRHILGFKDLGSIDKLISADVNGSGSITGTDLVVLRKLILGVYDKFPNGVPSWKFSNMAIEITDENMDDLTSNISFKGLSDDIFDLDFLGIKIGDVDDSVSKSRNMGHTRKDESLKLSPVLNLDENISIISFVTDRNVTVQGFQLELKLPQEQVINAVNSDVLPDFSIANYYIDNETIKISWSNNDDVELEDGSVLFYLKSDKYQNSNINVISNSKGQLTSEYYSEYLTYPILIDEIINPLNKEYSPGLSAQVNKNPFYDDAEITISSTYQEMLNYVISDASGRIINTGYYQILKGENRLVIEGEIFPSAGLYFLNLHSKNWTQTIKLVKTY